MAVTKSQARKVRQPTLPGDMEITSTLSATGTEVVELSAVAEKVTFQSSGTLAYSYELSANGKNWSTPVAVAANALSTASTHLAKMVRITWTSGSGKVTILAR